ncbi:hypothetical protein RLOC_00002901 [Lonchura striata]|uniref:Uncharacterized protein n=1 Tax=Lonchura striata TaxID=40157 RepID=A0A218UEQ3_9PASE|nr:hypothetical protein RLOC_00002901 [Lonchura striata domestica]
MPAPRRRGRCTAYSAARCCWHRRCRPTGR